MCVFPSLGDDLPYVTNFCNPLMGVELAISGWSRGSRCPRPSLECAWEAPSASPVNTSPGSTGNDTDSPLQSSRSMQSQQLAVMVVEHQPDSPHDSLEVQEVDVPAPGDGEVLLRVVCRPINPAGEVDDDGAFPCSTQAAVHVAPQTYSPVVSRRYSQSTGHISSLQISSCNPGAGR